MSQRTTPPFRADHVDSFLRPQYLRDACSGDFKPLRFLPRGKVETQRAKLRLVIETAGEVWGNAQA